MAKPVSIPNSFATSTSAIPLSYLDQDFNALANSTNDLATYSNYVADTGSANAYIANFPANTNTSSLTSGLRVQFKAANANTGTSTLNVQVNSVSIGSATIKLTDGSNLPAGAIVAGALVDVMYDGTNFQLLSDSSGGAEVITNLTLSGNLAFTGTGNRITGDFSNATLANRVAFQTSTTNGVTSVGIIPNGTATSAALNIETDSATALGQNAQLAAIGGTDIRLTSGIRGAASYLPMTFYTGGSERMRIDTSGNVGIGTNNPSGYTTRCASVATGDFAASFVAVSNSSAINWARIDLKNANVATNSYWYKDSSGLMGLYNEGAHALTFGSNNTERMRIDSSGNVGIGTSSPAQKLNVSGASNTYMQVNGGTGTGAGLLAYVGTTLVAAIADAATLVSGTTTDGAINSKNNLLFGTNNTERMRIDSSGNVGIGTNSPLTRLHVVGASNTGSGVLVSNQGTNVAVLANEATWLGTGTSNNAVVSSFGATSLLFGTNGAERGRFDASGNFLVGTTTANPAVTNGTGATFEPSGVLNISRNTEPSLFVNRKGNDGGLVIFYQDGTQEGSISVSGTTVSYNGGHISRWSQLYNETTKVEVYRGTVLESVDAMCEWYDAEGNLLPNEQSTKTIVSTTPASKAVAGVFDTYDNDDVDNPYDFYVAQSGDFIIRLAAGTVVQNGDLLESAGDGTARVQADDICRSSTIAKVTSNYVSATYDDGSFCVPCILMIG